MPSVKVFKDSALQETVVFRRQFMILELHRELHWHADEELAREARGEIRVWARPTKIEYVLPTWTLTINDTLYTSQIYEDIEIGERLIKLGFQGYDFVFYVQVDTPSL